MLKFNLKNLLPLVLLSLSLALTSCDPVNALARNLAGEWQITSYLIDGNEQVGNTYQSIQYDFSGYNGTQGTFTFTSIDQKGDRLVREGNYQLNEEGTQIDLILQDTSRVVLTHDVLATKEMLELSLFLGNATHEYRGEKN